MANKQTRLKAALTRSRNQSKLPADVAALVRSTCAPRKGTIHEGDLARLEKAAGLR